MTANTKDKEIYIVTRPSLYQYRREGYKHLPRACWRTGFGRTITAHAAQLAAWYARGIHNPRPMFILDWNWEMPNRSAKVSIVIFELGSGLIQFGKREVRGFVIPWAHLPRADFDSYEYKEQIAMFIRRMCREDKI